MTTNNENTVSDLTDTLSAPLGELISAVGRGVAEAQQALDTQVIKQMEALNLNDDQTMNNLRKIGYQPTWYQIPQANAEIMMSLAISANNQALREQGSPAISLLAAPVNATYTNSFNYDVNAFSSLSFKVVPVPPSTGASEARVVPELLHKKVTDARALLAQLALDYIFTNEEVDDEKTITDVSHKAGDIITNNEKLVLTHA